MAKLGAKLQLRSGQSPWLLAVALLYDLFFFAGIAVVASAITRAPASLFVLPVLLLSTAAWLMLLMIVVSQAGAPNLRSRARRFGAAVATGVGLFLAAGVFSVAWVGGPSVSMSLTFGGPGIALALFGAFFLSERIVLFKAKCGRTSTLH